MGFGTLDNVRLTKQEWGRRRGALLVIARHSPPAQLERWTLKVKVKERRTSDSPSKDIF